MKMIPLFAASAVLLLGSTSFGLAQKNQQSGATPGHEMQEHGSVSGAPGASGYAPGHNKDADDVKSNRGTTGAGDRDRDEKRLTRDRDDKSGKADKDDLKARDRDDRTTGSGDRDDKRFSKDKDDVKQHRDRDDLTKDKDDLKAK